MPLDYSNPITIGFLQENYSKENEGRIFWFEKNKENLLKMATLSEKHKGYTSKDVLKQSMDMGIEALSIQYMTSNVYRLRTMKEVPLPKTNRVPIENPMKPVEPQVTRLMYQDKSKGRLSYLHKRKEKGPEEKYNFCYTTNNIYGWSFGESVLGEASTHRRCYVLRRLRNNRVGAEPDPDLYNPPY